MSEDTTVSPSDDRPDDVASGEAQGLASDAAPSRPRPSPDLSREIEQAVERKAGDDVRCTKVGPDTYRCNWWCKVGTNGYDNPGMNGGQLATDHRIRRSAFLRVSKRRKGLEINELPSR
jgi:hypothetical protein